MVIGVEEVNNFIKSLFEGLDIFVFLSSKQGQILYRNKYFASKFPNSVSVHQIEHYFSFSDICVLNDKDILVCNPVREALGSSEMFFASAKFEQKRHSFRKVSLKSFQVEGNKLFVVAYEDLDKKNSELNKLRKEVEKLTSAASENQFLKQKAESQSVKSALLNRVSYAIRESFDLDQIVKKVISETVKTLGADSIAFFEQGKRKPKYNYKFREAIDFTRMGSESFVDGNKLIVPVVYVSKVLGYIAVSFSSASRQWQDDELVLVENIASQLAVSINQASLFEEIEAQKEELKGALDKLKEAQVQLVHSEKMASLGQLVAGIAHEINTPLGAINCNNDMVKRCLPKLEAENSGVAGVLNEIIPVNEDAIGRMNTLVKSLKNFARLDESEFQEADLHEGINSTLDLIRHELKNHIKVIKNFAELPKIKCYPNAINQVLMNLFVNACQAIEGEGVLSISTWERNNSVYIKVADTGKGIEKEHLSKVFDPGFTTKGVGVGTGLGLSISYKIIQDHKGDITVASEFGNGATFIVRLPIDNL